MHWWRRHLWLQRTLMMVYGVALMLGGCIISAVSLFRLAWPEANAAPTENRIAGAIGGIFLAWWGWRMFRSWRATTY